MELSVEMKLLADHHSRDSHAELVTFLFDALPSKHRKEEEWRHLLVECRDKDNLDKWAVHGGKFQARKYQVQVLEIADILNDRLVLSF